MQPVIGILFQLGLVYLKVGVCFAVLMSAIFFFAVKLDTPEADKVKEALAEENIVLLVAELVLTWPRLLLNLINLSR
jgi:hypothetical protein